MAKKTNKVITLKVNEPLKDYCILSGLLKDGLCNYSYEILKGPGTGYVHTVKGKGIVLDDLTNAFQALSVHLAIMDDVFKHAGIDVKGIAKMRNHEHTALYSCTGFKLSGTEENQMIVLKGSKVVSVGGQVELETPKILLDKFSAYLWYKELKDDLNVAVEEVELYNEGKCVIPEPEDFVDDNQVSLISDEKFDSGKV